MDRPTWPLPPQEEIASELREWDERSFSERIERWIFLRQLTDPLPVGWSLPGSVLCGSVWWEAGRCFIGGNFIAAVILTQGFVEHSLAEVLRRTGKVNVKGLGLKALIDAAEQIGELPPELATRLHGLRELRNPYVHADVETWPPPHLQRALAETAGDWYALRDGDARLAIEAAADYIRHVADHWDELRKPAAPE